jgi:hypothetical protein
MPAHGAAGDVSLRFLDVYREQMSRLIKLCLSTHANQIGGSFESYTLLACPA